MINTSRIAALTLATLTAAASSLGGARAADRAPDPCRATTQAVLESCKTGVRSDALLAGANCINLSDNSARKTCSQEATANAKDAMHECRDQADARQDVCKHLGGGAYDPTIDPVNFVSTIDNPYFPLTPGTTYFFEGQTASGLERGRFSVTHNTKTILGVTCVEVHDFVTLNGEPLEDTLDWFAQDRDGNVWYFGENSKQIENGLVVGVEGSWTAGINGAKPGIVMKAHPAVGDFYRQEFLLVDAEDLAEVISLNESVSVPAGAYNRCVETAETSPVSPEDLEHKYYALGIGNVLVIDVATGAREELVRIETE